MIYILRMIMEQMGLLNGITSKSPTQGRTKHTDSTLLILWSPSLPTQWAWSHSYIQWRMQINKALDGKEMEWTLLITRTQRKRSHRTYLTKVVIVVTLQLLLHLRLTMHHQAKVESQDFMDRTTLSPLKQDLNVISHFISLLL
jgi:hypothetical protein